MSTGNSTTGSPTTADGSADALDDEDSESSSSSSSPSPPAASNSPPPFMMLYGASNASSYGDDTSASLEAFYQNWRKEVQQKNQTDAFNASAIQSVKARLQFEDDLLQRINSPTTEEKGQLSDALDLTKHADDCLNEEELMDDYAVAVINPGDRAVSKTHISALPHEVLLRVFRWAVGSHLDTRVLGKLSRVCHGFYLLAHEPSLWRAICMRRWPSLRIDTESITDDESDGVTTEMQVSHKYGYVGWYDMALRRPHVLVDGCYLCRISYVRPGDTTMNICYRPMHLVVYYRGVRFYPDGRVCMLTSCNPPNAVVDALGDRTVNRAPTHASESASRAAAGGGGGGGDSETQQQPEDEVIGVSAGGLLQGTYAWSDPDMVRRMFDERL